MSILTPTDHYGEVTWLGLVPVDRKNICAEAVTSMQLTWDGPENEHHAGLTRPACVRVKRQYAAETEIRNVRQLSVLSAEELAEIAGRLELDEIRPEWVGANLILKGIPDFTLIPPASRLIFEDGTSLTTDTENAPCKYPAEQIEAAHPGHGRAFPAIARHKRGVTAWVERPGLLTIGSLCRLHIPAQPRWPHM
ncbi:MAG: sulfurase [Pseudomonadota bacterium]